MDPKILIVEDSPLQLDAIEVDLTEIPKDIKDQYGIRQFLIEKARGATEAQSFLKDAARSSDPFDILLVDLKLPLNANSKDEDTERGLQLIKVAKEKAAAREIIVVSAHYDEDENVVDAFRWGAVDFITKPYNHEDLQARVLNSWDRVLTKRSSVIFEERIKTLIPYAEKGLAHQFSACFSRLVQAMVHETEGMGNALGERLGLDVSRDSQDSLIRYLTAIEKAVNDAKREWKDIQSSLISEDEMPKAVVIDTLLREIEEELRPCLIVKRTGITASDNSAIPVLTFQEDVRTILKEIIVGGLSVLPDHGEPRPNVSVSVGSKEGKAEVRYTDQISPISSTAASSINSGFSIIPDEQFGREWGLSVAQHVALRGGGSLTVEPSEDGNIITYLIPLAHHA